ncbi:MAG: response regulator [Nitrospinae bacterium]|nr:response regulator [Nitrospinota bacterium]
MKKFVLIVDDDKTDVMAIQRSLKDMIEAKEIELESYSDGEEILAKLKEKISTGKLSEIPFPYMMFLDLNMPRVDGFEVLEAIRKDPILKPMVVFVLTTSNNPVDIARAYQQCIAGYLVKSDLGNRYEILKDLVKAYSKAVVPPIIE